MLRVAQTDLSEAEYHLLAQYAKQHKLTMKEALRIAAQKLVLDDKVYPDDPIFKNIQRASKPGRKTQLSVGHDKILYDPFFQAEARLSQVKNQEFGNRPGPLQWKTLTKRI